MKIFTSALVTETNTFSTFPTTMEAFEELGIVRGPITAAALTETGAIGGQWRRLAQHYGDELHEGLYAMAQPAGRVPAATYAQLRDELVERVRQAMPLDMALLFLHGAMAAEGVDDCEGDLLRAVREVVGAGCVIGVELDPHCHLSTAMTTHADAIVLMREYPHTDFEQRAIELFELCRAAASGATKPVMAVVDCRMVGFYPTTSEPMRGLVAALYEVERRPGILSASLVHGFPWGDVADAGSKVLVVADGDRSLAASVAQELAQRFYRLRHALRPTLQSIDQALAALPAGAAPLIVADAGDNPGGGAPCDHTVLLAALLQRSELRSAVGMLWDPEAVELCHAAGVGARLHLRIGGKAGPVSGQPLEVEVVVRATAERHTQQTAGMSDPLGRAAWVRAGATDIVLISRRQQTLSPSAFTGLGVPLHEARVIAVKSSHHYYAEFQALSTDCHIVETGAALSMDFAHLPYRTRGRDYFPAVENPAPELA
ncbi:M81 family metallopeptidase [Rugamonas aquatica]|uniref:Microcystinase C n=1 Tax=Rugamonas aquatica TaxID=2743357 RepID=A0A6A7N1B8_9BURK|nr:M81 family metallopeptidase [Rugamonas aquatica]MQA38618.1 microcystin LR degradation protein MlrC-like protein [Rugamonas aquatica]